MRREERSPADADAGLSLGVLLDRNKGLGPGFDFLRIALALSIVLAHSEQIATGAPTSDDHPLWLMVYLQVPMFFALSGFLVAGSASRLSLGNFFVHRALRIYPALITEVFLSIVLIGMTFTTVSYSEFFSSTKLYDYLTNLLGLPHYILPGVFVDNPLHLKVNGSLWTIPYELLCYGIMATMIAVGALRNNTKVVLITVGVTIFAVEPRVWYYLVGFSPTRYPGGIVEYVYENVLKPDLAMTFAYFCCGVTAYQFRDRIPYVPKAFAACVVILLVLSWMGKEHKPEAWFKLLMLPVGVYMTMFLGLTRLPLPAFLRSGDYSYGIYLYGFPVQQAVETVTKTNSVLLNFVAATPLIFLWSQFSWRFVEKPALRLKKRFSFADPRPRAAPEARPSRKDALAAPHATV